MTAATEPATVAEARQRHRTAAQAVGGHLIECTACEPRPGGRAVRNPCAEYTRVDAAERGAWSELERAREAGHGC